jgi:hypothetical protein
LFRFSTLLCLGSFTCCILSCFFRSKSLNTFHQTRVYAASVLADQDSLWLRFWCSLLCSPKPYLCPQHHLSS